MLLGDDCFLNKWIIYNSNGYHIGLGLYIFLIGRGLKPDLRNEKSFTFSYYEHTFHEINLVQYEHEYEYVPTHIAHDLVSNYYCTGGPSNNLMQMRMVSKIIKSPRDWVFLFYFFFLSRKYAVVCIHTVRHYKVLWM